MGVHYCTPEAVAPAAPNKAVSNATTILTTVLQFFIFYLLSFLKILEVKRKLMEVIVVFDHSEVKRTYVLRFHQGQKYRPFHFPSTSLSFPSFPFLN